MNQNRSDRIQDLEYVYDNQTKIVENLLDSFKEQGYAPAHAVMILSSALVTILINTYNDELSHGVLDQIRQKYDEVTNGRTRSPEA